MFGRDGFTFWDLVDIINPLQHIPVISSIYRAITGDEIDPGSRIAGGTLFGGPIGAAASVANVIVEHNTGKDLGEHVMALLGDDQSPEIATAAISTQAAPKNQIETAARGTLLTGNRATPSQWVFICADRY